jgi:hypothetical protein
MDGRSWVIAVDLVVASAVVGGALFARQFFGGVGEDGSRPAAIGLIAVLGGGSSLIAMWLCFGGGRWSVRLSMSIAAWALIWVGPLWVWGRFHLRTTAIPIAGAAITATVFVEMLLMRWLGYVVQRESPKIPLSALQNSGRQLPLRDLFLLPAAVGVAITVGRLTALPEGMTAFWMAQQVAVVGTLAVLIAIAGWTTLSERPAAIRLPLGLALMGLLAIAPGFAMPTIGPWYAIVQGAVGWYILLCLLILRRCGWRLYNRLQSRPSDS